jgi:uncharacterized membrane protein
MDYAILKTLHILSATVLFGTGLGTAFFMWRANLTGDVRVIASVAKQVVLADWLFTTPTVIFQPLSGIWLTQQAGYAWNGWITLSLALYGLAGMCWLPVVWLQLRMQKVAEGALQLKQPLPAQYHFYARVWFCLGVPAFLSMVSVFFLMVLKHT